MEGAVWTAGVKRGGMPETTGAKSRFNGTERGTALNTWGSTAIGEDGEERGDWSIILRDYGGGRVQKET